MNGTLLRAFLDAVRDDAYGLPELWSIARGRGISEETARRTTRDALLELQRRGHVKFLREQQGAPTDELNQPELETLRYDDAAWGIGNAAEPTVLVTTTPTGDEALELDKNL